MMSVYRVRASFLFRLLRCYLLIALFFLYVCPLFHVHHHESSCSCEQGTRLGTSDANCSLCFFRVFVPLTATIHHVGFDAPLRLSSPVAIVRTDIPVVLSVLEPRSHSPPNVRFLSKPCDTGLVLFLLG